MRKREAIRHRYSRALSQPGSSGLTRFGCKDPAVYGKSLKRLPSVHCGTMPAKHCSTSVKRDKVRWTSGGLGPFLQKRVGRKNIAYLAGKAETHEYGNGL